MQPTKRAVTRLLDLARGRGEEGLFLLEGPKAIRDALPTGFVAEVWYAGEEGRERHGALVNAAQSAGVHVGVLPPREFERVAQTEAQQGILALVRDVASTPEAVLGAAGWVVWLDGVQDPGNVGAIVRVAAGLGAAGLLLAAGSAHPLRGKALRASAGHALSLPFAFAEGEDLLRAVAASGRPLWVLDADGRDLEHVLAETPPERPGVLVVGSEGRGLSPLVAGAAAERVAIRLAPAVESLNAAVAAGIALYRLSRGKRS